MTPIFGLFVFVSLFLTTVLPCAFRTPGATLLHSQIIDPIAFTTFDPPSLGIRVDFSTLPMTSQLIPAAASTQINSKQPLQLLDLFLFSLLFVATSLVRHDLFLFHFTLLPHLVNRHALDAADRRGDNALVLRHFPYCLFVKEQPGYDCTFPICQARH